MNKKSLVFLSTLILILLAAGTVPQVIANEDTSENEIRIETEIKSSFFETSGQGKAKTQLRIKSNEESENSEFMIKGVVSAFSANSLTIDGKTINIDSSVVEEIKVVGKIKVGAYAMVKGIIVDSTYYAKKIVIDNRNKKDIEENESLSPTPTPLLTASGEANLEESAEGGVRINFNMKALLESFRDILNAFRNFFQTI